MLIISIILFAVLSACSFISETGSQQNKQFPSPMVENIRTHERIENKAYPGLTFSLKNVLSKPIEIYQKENLEKFKKFDLLIHFHGASYVPKNAVFNSKTPILLAIVNLGSGSSVYEKAFLNELVFPKLIDIIVDSVSANNGFKIELSKKYLSSFSAGYGAVRAILKNHKSELDGILLLDGLHTDYDPPAKVLAEGGKLNTEKLNNFLKFAQLAVNGRKKILISHSEIFPGTYASTTETADWLISSLKLKRTPILKWGPAGMQQLSETVKKGFTILAFAGNSAPDHVDHFHGLPQFLELLLEEN